MKKLHDFLLVMLFLEILISQIVLIPLVSAQEGEVTLNPTDDTFVDDITAVGNFGNLSFLEVGKYEDPVVGPVESIGWLKFNLSSVPDGAVVDVATLQLYSYAVTETYNVYARFCSNNSWTELTLTHANMPDFNATSMDSEVVATSSKWYNWTVTDAVQHSVDGIFGGPDMVTIVLLETSLHGLGMDLTVFFYSKEGSDLYMPKLTIHWTDVIPEFPSFLILPLFMIATLLAVVVYRRKHSM
jgi:hypothetical protein